MVRRICIVNEKKKNNKFLSFLYIIESLLRENKRENDFL